MKITRTSILSGRTSTREIPVTQEQLDAWQRNRGTVLIQDAFPDLSPDDREFILTGITPEEWDEAFAPDE